MFLEKDDERTLQETLEMCQIPAPSYQEEKKAEYVLGKMQEAGLEDVHIDEVGNVLGVQKGKWKWSSVSCLQDTLIQFSRWKQT